MIKKTRLIVVIWLQLTLAAFTVCAQSQADKIDEMVTAYAKQYKFNGSVLVVNKGKVVFSKGYGFKNARDTTYNDVNTIYQLGSVTKQFTAAIILQLQQQKKLSVLDKLSKYFPDYPQGDKITIEHLLTHTSGIFNYTNDGKFMAGSSTKPATQEAMMALFRDKPLDFEPGTQWRYSNSGYSLLGYIIEKVTGKTYEQEVRERIFKPLKMTHSGFDFKHVADKDKATGYMTYTEKVKIPSAIVDSFVSYAAGAIYSNVNDLWQWHKGLLKGTVLKTSIQEKGYKVVKNRYGYGWGIDSVYGRRVLAHSGGILGFNTNIARITKDNVCVVLLANMNTSELGAINRSIIAILYDQYYELPKEKVAINVDTAILKQYVGEYQLAPNLLMTIRLVDGALKGRVTGQGEFDMYAESENRFFLKVVEATGEFVKSADGKVEKLIWTQGSVTEAPKIK